jgi:hypothetical protein
VSLLLSGSSNEPDLPSTLMDAEPAGEKVPPTGAVERQEGELQEPGCRPTVADGPAGNNQGEAGHRSAKPRRISSAASPWPRHLVKPIEKHQEAPFAAEPFEEGFQPLAGLPQLPHTAADGIEEELFATEQFRETGKRVPRAAQDPGPGRL